MVDGPTTEHPGSATDRSWFPGRRFQEDLRGSWLNGALLAPDDAGNSLRPLGIGDDHVGSGETPGFPIKAQDLLTLVRPSNDDPPVLETPIVEGVHRLADLEHDVVRDVDDVEDRSHARRPQPRLHPRRRRPDLNAGHEPTDKPPAPIGCFDPHQLVGGSSAV